MNHTWALGAGMLLAAGVGFTAAPSVARACGGCFGPSETEQVVTDHRMVMAIHPTQSVLWDQIRYTGNPSEFSWVLPVLGDVQIQLASSDFFTALDSATAVRVQAPPLQQPNCPYRSSPSGAFYADAASASDGGSVQVLHEATVGPYETVTLRSSDAGALTAWLTMHSYTIPPAIQPVIQFYVDRGLDFVAMRLQPGEGISAMQPVRIVYSSANMVLPLRMVAAGIGDKVGIALWVFGNGRYEAANFANGGITASQVSWNWDTASSDYETVFERQIATLGGRAWLTEYADDAGAVRYQVAGYGSCSGYGCYGADAGADGGAAPTAADDWALATDHDAPGTWVTRMRTDLLARYLDVDLQLQASTIDAPVSRFLQVQQGHETGTRPPIATCPDYGGGGGSSTGGISGGGCNASNVAPGASGRALGAGLLGAALALVVARRRRARR